MSETTRIRIFEIGCAYISGYYYGIILFSVIFLVLSVLIRYLMVCGIAPPKGRKIVWWAVIVDFTNWWVLWAGQTTNSRYHSI
jgi:hypothetical protein